MRQCFAIVKRMAVGVTSFEIFSQIAEGAGASVHSTKKKKKKLSQKSWKEQSSLEESHFSLVQPQLNQWTTIRFNQFGSKQSKWAAACRTTITNATQTYFPCNNASKGSILTILFLYALTIDMHISFINSLMHVLECLWRHLHDNGYTCL